MYRLPSPWSAPAEAPPRNSGRVIARNHGKRTSAHSAHTSAQPMGAAVRLGLGLRPATYAPLESPTHAGAAPAGGIRLRLRAPLEHAGKLSKVTIGGQAWSAFSAAEETIEIAAEKITSSLIKEGLPHIVVTFT